MNKVVDVENWLAQRPPFLFIDAAEATDDLRGLVATRLYRAEEPYFAGHFPGNPIVPGVLTLEGMAQAARLLLNLRAGGIQKGYLAAVDGVRFNAPLVPGDQVQIKVSLGEEKIGLSTFSCSVFNGNSRAARAKIILSREGARE